MGVLRIPKRLHVSGIIIGCASRHFVDCQNSRIRHSLGTVKISPNLYRCVGRNGIVIRADRPFRQRILILRSFPLLGVDVRQLTVLIFLFRYIILGEEIFGKILVRLFVLLQVFIPVVVRRILAILLRVRLRLFRRRLRLFRHRLRLFRLRLRLFRHRLCLFRHRLRLFRRELRLLRRGLRLLRRKLAN